MKTKLSLLLMWLVAISLSASGTGKQYAGGDISLLPMYEGMQAKYYDYDGQPIDDVVKWFADEGMNVMRVRLMVNPDRFPGDKDANVCQTLDYILPICKRIKEAGVELLLDFHYSDYWADPYKQWTPEDWKDLNDQQLVDKLYTYTRDCLVTLRDNGVVPDLIQTGNEISFGMLWGPYGTPESELKKATGENDSSCWQRLTDMLKSAGRACREICPDAKIILHTEQLPNHWNLWNFYRWMRDFNVDYDVIGLSWYPYWHGDVGVLDTELTDLEQQFPTKKIMLVEFNWPYGWEADGANQLYDKYPHDYNGQQKITQATIDVLNRHPNANGLVWWWPEFNKKDYVKPENEAWDGWYSSPLFDSNNGRALPATKTLTAYAQGETVYFTNLPEGWTSAGVYCWTDGDANEGGWPGNAVTLTDLTYKGKPVWKYTFTGNSHKYLILNNRHQDSNGNWVSTDQTFDLTFRDGAIYYLQDWRSQGEDGSWKYDVWVQEEDAVADLPCVYLTNIPTHWTNPSLSAWTGGVNEADGEGLELTDFTYGGKPVYKFTFTSNFHDNLLFFNAPWNDSDVTPSLEFVNGALYILSDSRNAESDTKYSAPWVVRPSFDRNNDGSAGALYLFGNLNGVEDWSGYKDTFKANRQGVWDSAYTFDIDLRQEGWFRLCTDDGTEWGPAGEDIYLNNGDNDKETVAWSGKAFHLEAGSYTIVVEYYDGKYVLGVGDRRSQAVYHDLYMMGEFTGWAADHDFRLYRQADGRYSREFPDGLPSGAFKISTADWAPASSAGAVDLPINYTVRCYEMNRSGQDMRIAEAINSWAKVIFDPVNHTVRVEGPKAPVSESYENRIYMHFGQSRQTYGDLTVAPKIHLFADNRPDEPSVEEATGWNTFEMTRALEDDDSYDLWYYTLTDDQLSWAVDASFIYTRKDGSIEQFTCGRLVNDDDFNWDYKQWLKYIYFADVADNYNGKAAQSYLTLPRFRELRQAEKNKLYVVGQGLTRLGPTKEWHTSGWDRVVEPDIYSADASMGVFYLEDIQANDNLAQSNTTDSDHAEHWGTKFKMSWIYPYGGYEYSGYSGGSINQQRAWATFNLGIIGYGLRRAAAVNLLPTFGQNKTNFEVYCASCMTLPTNNFNQYDWFVDREYLNQTYTLVVDLHADCGSVTLLPFKPNPTVDNPSVAIAQRELDSYDEAQSLWNNGQEPMMAEPVNGKVLYKKYNVASAIMDVNAPNSATIQNAGYSVEYELYRNGNRAGTYYGTPGKVELAGIPVDEANVLGVRAKYTDNQTRFTFHSKYAAATEMVSATFAAPVLEEPQATFLTKLSREYEADGINYHVVYGAYAELPVTVTTDLCWYGDFELTPSEFGSVEGLSKGGELIHAAHGLHEAEAGNQITSLDGWMPYDNSEFGSCHDWTDLLSHTYRWPVYLPVVKRFPKKSTYNDVDRTAVINATCAAVYPFLIDYDAVPVGIGASAEMAAQADAAPMRSPGITDGHRYYLTLVKQSADRQFTLMRSQISGLEEAIGGETACDARYYDMRGIEVDGHELAPGIYIRRTGDSATKIIVR